LQIFKNRKINEVGNVFPLEFYHMRILLNVNTLTAHCAGGWFLLYVFMLGQVFFGFRMDSPFNLMV